MSHLTEPHLFLIWLAIIIVGAITVCSVVASIASIFKKNPPDSDPDSEAS